MIQEDDKIISDEEIREESQSAEEDTCEILKQEEESEVQADSEKSPEIITAETIWNDAYRGELEEAAFVHSTTTVKKGDGIDTITIICGMFGIACAAFMIYSGMTESFTSAMKALLVCYTIIIVWCFCPPLQRMASENLWTLGFIERFPINKGCNEKVEITEEEFVYTDVKGREVKVSFDDINAVYETEHCVVFHIDDKRIFVLDSEKLKEEETYEKLISVISSEE